MVKNGKGGRVMNPADAFRKAERKKEIARNKAERKFVRDAGQKKDTPAELRDELAALIDAEQAAPLSKLQKIRKKVLQEAYDGALKRQKVCLFMICVSCVVLCCVGRRAAARNAPSSARHAQEHKKTTHIKNQRRRSSSASAWPT